MTKSINADDPDSWKRQLRPNTKGIYVETLSNPLLQVPDLRSVVRLWRFE